METTELLRDVVVLLAVSLPVVFLFQRVKVPALVGFLAAGLLMGPSATGLIRRPETANVLAEIGVVLLLFTIGLEVSLRELTRFGRTVLAAGSLQVLATIAVVALIAGAAGASQSEALVLGFVISLSSTVIALKTLVDRGELDSPHGRLALGVLLFQDLCVVPMMMLLPVLSGPAGIEPGRVLLVLGKASLVIAAVFYVARIAFPAVMRQVLRLRIRELFVGAIVLLCLGTAWVTAQLGVSLALGAFIAGLVISESEYSHQVIAEVLPLRDLLTAVFFVSVGMLVDVGFVAEHAPLVFGFAAGVIALKTLLGAGAVRAFHGSPRIALLVGMVLAQVGEFSFVLAREAAHRGALRPEIFQSVLGVSVLTMLFGPFVIAAAPALALRLFESRMRPDEEVAEPAVRNHVVVVGYGLNGQNLARVLRATAIPYRILDLNADMVRRAAAAGEPITFGDATRPNILQHARVPHAAVVVVAISDPVATRRVVSLIRQLNPGAAVIVRTRFVSEIEELYALGAEEVIPEEFETSVEIFARVLQRMHIPRNVIELQVDLIRGERYAMLRGLALTRRGVEDLRAILEASTVQTFRLAAESPAVSRSLRDLDLRGRTGVTVIAVVRDGQSHTNPPADFAFGAGDVLVMLGSHAELTAAALLLDPAD